jgi:protein-tyrosine phosphatase
MRAIIPQCLWIGNAVEARDVTSVLEMGIEVVIDLAIEEKPIQFPREIAYCRFPLLDGSGNKSDFLQAAVESTARFVAANRPTLICCGAGMSRSPAVAAKVLSRLRGCTAQDALLEIADHGPHDVSPLFWSELCKTVPDR